MNLVVAIKTRTSCGGTVVLDQAPRWEPNVPAG